LKVRVSLWSQNRPPPTSPFPNNMTCMSTHCNCAFCPSWLVKFRQSSLCLSLALEYPVGSNINTGLWNEHQFLITKLFCSVLYPYNLDKTNFQTLEISTKIILYNYRKAQRCASCCAEILCTGCGAVISNTQPSIYQKRLGQPSITGILYSSHFVTLDLFCCPHGRNPYFVGITFLQMCPVIERSLNKANHRDEQ
jgi:hypothetical protein